MNASPLECQLRGSVTNGLASVDMRNGVKKRVKKYPELAAFDMLFYPLPPPPSPRTSVANKVRLNVQRISAPPVDHKITCAQEPFAQREGLPNPPYPSERTNGRMNKKKSNRINTSDEMRDVLRAKENGVGLNLNLWEYLENRQRVVRRLRGGGGTRRSELMWNPSKFGWRRLFSVESRWMAKRLYLFGGALPE